MSNNNSDANPGTTSAPARRTSGHGGPTSEDAFTRHSALLVAHLLAATPRPLAAYLTVTFTEMERTALMD